MLTSFRILFLSGVSVLVDVDEETTDRYDLFFLIFFQLFNFFWSTGLKDGHLDDPGM